MQYWCRQMTWYNIEIKLLMRLKMVFFCLNIKKKKKKTDDATRGYVLKDVNDLIQEMKLIE